MPYIDRTLYKFGFRTEVEDIILGTDRVQVLKRAEACRQLLVPQKAVLTIEFGIDRDRAKCQGSQQCAGIFQATLQRDQTKQRLLMDTRIKLSQPELSMTQRFDLSGYAYEKVKLCLRAFTSSNLKKIGKRSPLFWRNPKIHAKRDPVEEAGQNDALNSVEEKTLAKQLKALGYMN